MRRVTQVILLLASAPAWAATLYTNDGVVTAREEHQRWLINRSRYAPETGADISSLTNATPGGHPNYDVCEDSVGANDFGTTSNAWALWTASHAPLAPNAMLTAAAEKHARDMAETALFQHESPSSKYYPIGSLPAQRQTVEGYANNVIGFYENIAYGWNSGVSSFPQQGRSAESIFAALFIDTTASGRGHRQAILNLAAREIGIGSCHTNIYVSPFYRAYDYDVHDLARTSTNHYFTDTIYYDSNTNGLYDEGEGVGGVEIHLWNGANEALAYDASGPSGSFAIPINDLPDGSNIWVELRNAGSPKNVTIPFGFNAAGDVKLTNNGSFWLGAFDQPNGITNVGFRNISPFTDFRGAACVPGALRFNLAGFRRAKYAIEYSNAGPQGPWEYFSTVTATDEFATVDMPLTGTGLRIYRACLMKD